MVTKQVQPRYSLRWFCKSKQMPIGPWKRQGWLWQYLASTETFANSECTSLKKVSIEDVTVHKTIVVIVISTMFSYYKYVDWFTCLQSIAKCNSDWSSLDNILCNDAEQVPQCPSSNRDVWLENMSAEWMKEIHAWWASLTLGTHLC